MTSHTGTPTATAAPWRRRAVALAAAVIAAGSVGAATVQPAAARPADRGTPTSGTTRGGVVQDGLDRLVTKDGFPGALASVSGVGHGERDYTAGVGDARTKAPVPRDGQVRIGSNTKMFTAVVILQLVGSGQIRLDASVDTYLPGLLRGNGIDGRHITVRQLLQHTSGLPNYTNEIGTHFLPHQHEYLEPRQLIDIALTQKAQFAPGTSWAYSNTNYVTLGLIAQRVTGRPLGELITDRVIDRIGLRHTYFPNTGDERIHGRHPHGYYRETPTTPLTDVTVQDTGWAWAAGAIVATPSDVNRFMTALLGGRLLPAAQLREMQQTVPATDLGKDARYGLGLISVSLPCGGLAWGHGGDVPGYATSNYATTGGRAVTVAVTRLQETQAEVDDTEGLVKTALCAK